MNKNNAIVFFACQNKTLDITNDFEYLSDIQNIKDYDFLYNDKGEKIAVMLSVSPIKDDDYLDSYRRINRLKNKDIELYYDGSNIFLSADSYYKAMDAFINSVSRMSNQ